MALAAFAVPAARASWIQVSDSHFQIQTTAGEARARTALDRFEQVRSFFLQASPFAKAGATPVKIVAFSSAAEYRPFHPSETAASFYTRDKEHDYVVMQDLEPDHFIYAVHEYTHLLIARSQLRLPLWMNEGWADLNSTLTVKGGKAMIGDLIAGRRDALLANPWIPLADLDKVDQRSPLYNEHDKASVFYGESWALVHMLFLAPDYRKKFEQFVQATVSGKDLEAACQAVYGKPASAVQRDLVTYIGNGKLDGAVFAYRTDTARETPSVKPVSDTEAGVVLADLLTLTHKFAEARTALEALAKEHPESAAAEEALGYLLIKTGEQSEGVRHLKRAFDLGSGDAVMCYRLAVMLHATTLDRGAVLAILRRALALQPDYTDARLQLGVTLLEAQDYAGSLSELRMITKVPEASAPWYFSATAIDNARLGHAEEASKNLELARKWAKTPAQIGQVEQVYRSLNGK